MRKPIQYELAKADPLPGILPPVTVREFKGANTYDPFSIPDGFWTDMSNMTTDDFPALSVRPGYTQLGATIGSKMLGLGSWKDTELHAVFNDGTWRKWTGGAWSSALASGLDTSADWTFTHFQGNLDDINLIGSNGVDPIKRYDGSTVQSLTGAPSGGNFITTYQNRLWCGVGKELHASKLDDPTSWASFLGTGEDSYVKDMESGEGEDINMLSASLTKLTIGMPNGLQEMYGSLPSDFNFQFVTEDEGFSNNKSVTTLEGTMRFIHKTGLYTYAGGVLPSKDFSDIIAGYLTGIDSGSVAGADGTKLYFKAGSSILVYDPRPGVDAWSVWDDIDATQFIVFQHELYIGDNAGRVLKLGGTSDAGSAINWYAITGPFTNASTAMMQRWYKLFVVAELADGSTFNVSLSKSATGDSDWELVQTVTVTGTGIAKQRIIVPVGKYALENYIRIKFHGSGWVRLHEYTRQMRQMPLY